MSPLEATQILNEEAQNWRLNVGRNSNDVDFYVSGNVLALGRRRNVRPFSGGRSRDAREALIRGVGAMEREREPRG